MRKLSSRLEMIDEKVRSLRQQMRKRADPIAVGRSVAALYLDDIARIRSYLEQLDRAIGHELFAVNLTFEENVARVGVILRILARLQAMLVMQIDRFLKCFGGAQAILAQQLVKGGEDPASRDFLVALANATRSRRRR